MGTYVGWYAARRAPTNNRPPTYLPIHPPTCHITNLRHQLPTFPPTALLTHLPTYLTYVPIGLPIYPPTCPLPTDTPTHLPSDYLPTYLPNLTDLTYLPTYLPNLTYQQASLPDMPAYLELEP